MISSNELHYFIEIASTKNLSRAAERLGTSQPTLTQAIKRIEYDLGADILIRSKKGVSLTPAGKNLLKHSKVMMQYWEQVKSEALASVNEISGSLSLGCHPSVGLYTLDKFLPTIYEKNPSLEISLHHDLSRNILEKVISLKIDLGLVINPMRHPDLIIQPLLEDTVTLWKSNKSKASSGDDLLICDPSLIQTQDILKKLKKRKLNFKRVITSSSLENIANLVAAGIGVGILPSRVANKVTGKKLSMIKEAPLFKDSLAIIYRMENKKVRAVQYIVEEVIKSLRAH